MPNSLSPFSILSDFTDTSTPNPIQQFMKKLANPCENDSEEDCGEIKSPCCQAELKTCFSTLPLEVECQNCHLHHFLRDLVPKD